MPAVAPGHAELFIGVTLWGAYLELTQGLLPALAADTAPEDLRATTFGMFNLITGVTLLATGLLAGLLWQGVGSVATFGAGGIFAAIAAFGLMVSGASTCRT